MINQNTSGSALIIFIKNAEKGKVKTRLASTVGDELALKIYMALMDHTRKIAESQQVNRLLFYSRFINREDRWPASHFQKFLQHGADLGVRISNAFKQAFTSYQKVIIIGSDCASLTPEIVAQAFDHLESHDFVIGPAIDGGYYLLGMKQETPTVFKDIEWSTEKVAAQTIERINSLNRTYALLPELSDIDHAEDWEKYGWPLD